MALRDFCVRILPSKNAMRYSVGRAVLNKQTPCSFLGVYKDGRHRLIQVPHHQEASVPNEARRREDLP